jgi:NitT/TauT family transport system substrate-binding protein
MKIRRLSILIGIAALVATSAGHAAEKVTVRLKWFNQAQFAGFYVAKEKGFYQAAGLDVSIEQGGPDFPSIQMVAGGNEEFGVTSADQILVARSKGVPVTALAVLYRKSPFVLFSLAKSGIDKPEKFVGKKIGVKLGGNEELVYRELLKKVGLDGKNMAETPVKFDMTPLLTGQVDLWPGYVINEVVSAREKGFAVNVIWPTDYGINMYADTVFTTEKMIKEKPQLVQGFTAATLKGWTYAAANPEEAAKITVKYGTKLTYEHELAMMKESLPLLQPDKRPIGSMDPAVWSAMQTSLVQGRFMKKPIDLSTAYTTRFLAP